MGIDNESRLCLGVKLQKASASEEASTSGESSSASPEVSGKDSSSGEASESEESCDVLRLYNFLKGRKIAFVPNYIDEDEESPEDDPDFAELISKEWDDILDLVNRELKKSESNFRVKHACPFLDCSPEYVVFYLNYKPVENGWACEGISLSEAREAFDNLDIEEMNALLQEFGVEEQEPRLFSLPHVY